MLADDAVTALASGHPVEMTDRQTNRHAAYPVAHQRVPWFAPRGHYAASEERGGGGKSDALSGIRWPFAMAISAGRRHSGTKFFRCQLWTVVAGIPAFSATAA